MNKKGYWEDNMATNNEKKFSSQELTAEYSGDITIGEITIKCAVLSNEKRVFYQREAIGALTGNKKGGMERYLTAKNLAPYVPEKYKGEKWDDNIIKFKSGNNDAHGFEATDLIDICNMYIQARNDGTLLSSQSNLAKRADIIVNAFAKTGVIAVIDEATGYQLHRKKDALRLLVQAYVIEEAREWTKEFPDEFFVELDRIYNNPTTKPQKRPQYYGHFINKYVYEPIESGLVLDKLQELNPSDEKGARKKRFHQFLNEELGIRVLRNRIGKVTALLQVSSNKRKFQANYERMESKQMRLFNLEEFELEEEIGE
jgi:hypothetical protein